MTFWSGKRVVVTGAGGFLGSHVMEKLREAGPRAVYPVHSKDYDLTKESSVARLFDDLRAGVNGWPAKTSDSDAPLDVFIHLAGLVGGIGANKAQPADFFYQNLLMGVLCMHYAWKSGAEKFVAAGAGCGYPEHAPLPLKEESFWDGLPQHESAPYSLAKRMLQVQALAYHRQHGFKAVVTVPGNIYGPYDNFDLENAHVVPALVRKFVEATGPQPHPEVVVWGSGTPTRDFVYAGDVARGILLAAAKYETPELVNLSAGKEHSIQEIVRHLVDITGFPGRIQWDRSRPDGQARRCMDVSKANKDLGFRAQTSLRDGLAATVLWYRAHRENARNVEPIS